ncbi:MAG TPA: hypothetical protein VI670_11000 [Thermoanaerobaculia bacterium]|jgi:hypothetical protein
MPALSQRRHGRRTPDPETAEADAKTFREIRDELLAEELKAA